MTLVPALIFTETDVTRPLLYAIIRTSLTGFVIILELSLAVGVGALVAAVEEVFDMPLVLIRLAHNARFACGVPVLSLAARPRAVLDLEVILCTIALLLGMDGVAAVVALLGRRHPLHIVMRGLMLLAPLRVGAGDGLVNERERDGLVFARESLNRGTIRRYALAVPLVPGALHEVLLALAVCGVGNVCITLSDERLAIAQIHGFVREAGVEEAVAFFALSGALCRAQLAARRLCGSGACDHTTVQELVLARDEGAPLAVAAALRNALVERGDTLDRSVRSTVQHGMSLAPEVDEAIANRAHFAHARAALAHGILAADHGAAMPCALLKRPRVEPARQVRHDDVTAPWVLMALVEVARVQRRVAHARIAWLLAAPVNLGPRILILEAEVACVSFALLAVYTPFCAFFV